MGYWGNEDAEIKILSVENPGMNYVLLLKSGVVQNIATHASPIDMNFFLVLISTFSVYSHPFFFFFQILSLRFKPMWAHSRIK